MRGSASAQDSPARHGISVGVVAAAALAMLGGCALFGGGARTYWASSEIGGLSFERLWKEVHMVLWSDPARFQIASEDRDAGTLTTYWRFFSYQFANDAWTKRRNLRHPYRLRVTIAITPRLTRGYRVAVRVERERNTDEVDPSNESRASWSKEADDRDKAEQILFRIENSVEVYRSNPAGAGS